MQGQQLLPKLLAITVKYAREWMRPLPMKITLEAEELEGCIPPHPYYARKLNFQSRPSERIYTTEWLKTIRRGQNPPRKPTSSDYYDKQRFKLHKHYHQTFTRGLEPRWRSLPMHLDLTNGDPDWLRTELDFLENTNLKECTICKGSGTVPGWFFYCGKICQECRGKGEYYEKRYDIKVAPARKHCPRVSRSVSPGAAPGRTKRNL